MIAELLPLAVAYGPVGLGFLYFAWRDAQRDKREEKRQDRLEEILDKNAESDKEVALALGLLAERMR